jgi:hypothetical protein
VPDLHGWIIQQIDRAGRWLAGDWIDLLPPPGGAHHSEYAARLRTLAQRRT